MADLIDMAAHESRRRKREVRKGGAEIMLFMGVRYERIEESPRVEEAFIEAAPVLRLEAAQ